MTHLQLDVRFGASGNGNLGLGRSEGWNLDDNEVLACRYLVEPECAVSRYGGAELKCGHSRDRECDSLAVSFDRADDGAGVLGGGRWWKEKEKKGAENGSSRCPRPTGPERQ